MHIGLIGLGRVGNATFELLNSRAKITTWDIKSGADYPRLELSECDFVIICVDTPALDSGAADVRSVEDAVRGVPCEMILLKSTVPPGTTDQISRQTGKQICYWPSFISESAYYNPFFPSRLDEIPFVILGGDRSVRTWFIDILMPILGPTKTYFQCTASEAEVIKYASNSYFATKITFVNEMRRICEALDVDWHAVREGWLLDPRVERMHTGAFSKAPGFSGKCLPKDLSALVSAAQDAGYRADFLSAVKLINKNLRADGDKMHMQ